MAAPAAASDAQDKVISNYCDNNTDSQDCNDWRYNRASWSAQQYQSFYLKYQSDPAFQSAEAEGGVRPAGRRVRFDQRCRSGHRAGQRQARHREYRDAGQPELRYPGGQPSAGGTAGGTVSSTTTGNVVKTVPEVQGDSPTHIQDCLATYKSYDPSTDTYMGLSGERHRCKL
jgi:hypothetical protein